MQSNHVIVLTLGPFDYVPSCAPFSLTDVCGIIASLVKATNPRMKLFGEHMKM